MEPSGWCHFNFWFPNRSKTRPPYLPLPSLFFLSLSHPHLGGRGLPAHGTVCEGGRAAGPGTGGPGPRGTRRRRGTCCSGLPSRLSQLFRSGRLEAWRESWDVSVLPRFAFEWAGWQRGDEIGEAGARIPIEMRLPLQTDTTTLTERLWSTDPGRGSGLVEGEAAMGGNRSEWKQGPA